MPLCAADPYDFGRTQRQNRSRLSRYKSDLMGKTSIVQVQVKSASRILMSDINTLGA